MFINKFDKVGDIIDLDVIKENFKLDPGEEGFYKLSLYQKKILGDETINETYNRPPIGPIENGLYCSWCEKIGPEDHSMTCDFPEQNSLYLSISGFKNYILSNTNYRGDYEDFKNKFLNKNLTQEDLDEILLNEGEISVQNGTFDISNNLDVLTGISYYGIYKKTGPRKIANKTATTNFLNNIIIFYEKNGEKTSIRISKNGLINLINIPKKEDVRDVFIKELINRVNNSGAVNIENFNDISKLNSDSYIKIDKLSFIHSATSQFSLNPTGKGEVDFEELNNLISPYDRNGNIIQGKYTQVSKIKNNPIIILDGLKIIEWNYAVGRKTRNNVSTKEYIKFVTNPIGGIKITGVINKSGIVMLSISYCNDKQIEEGICSSKENDTIDIKLFNKVKNTFQEIFKKEKNSLLKPSLDDETKGKLIFNTVSGYAPGRICRSTRTRDSGESNYKEGMRPFPYSWKGTCPDPNYQYLKPEGVKDKDGLWYPCCETKNKKSIEKMKNYLITGFPKNQEERNKYNISLDEDFGTGILIPGSNSIDANANVKINGNFEKVVVLEKLKKASNEYKVKRSNGEVVTVKGTDFEKDSRIFPGLKSFTKEKLLDCIIKNLKKTNSYVSEDGTIKLDDKTQFKESLNQANSNHFKSLVKLDLINKKEFTYNSYNDFNNNEVYNVLNVPGDSYNFYLVLSPYGNYYINDKLNSIESQISNNFSETIVFNGFLRENDADFTKNEFHIIDIVYHNGQNLQEVGIVDRINTLYDIQAYESQIRSIVEEIILFPANPDIPGRELNIIDKSYEIISKNNSDILIFISDKNIITWGENIIYSNELPLQILKRNKETIDFGYNNESFPSGIGLDFFNEYTFNKRDIPPKLFLNDYFKIKINRDFDGNVVPNRKISILNKINKPNLSYEKLIEKLLVVFNPIDKSFFLDSNEEWDFMGGNILSFTD